MKNKTWIFIFLLAFFGCKKEEIKLSLEVLDKNVNIFNKEFDGEELTIKNLKVLKEISDKTSLINKTFKNTKLGRTTNWSIKRFLTKNYDIKYVCSNWTLRKETQTRINNLCSLEYFNICPLNYLDYKKNIKENLMFLKTILGNETYLKTDCPKEIN